MAQTINVEYDDLGQPYHELIDGSRLYYYTSDNVGEGLHLKRSLLTQQSIDNHNAAILGKEIERESG